MKNFTTLIMAAGKGTRMKSDMAKVLHTLDGKPMVHYVIRLARELGSSRIIGIIGHQKDRVREELAGEKIEFVVQEPQLGTGHAVMQSEELLKSYNGPVLVLSGDAPLLTFDTMRKFLDRHFESRAAATVLTAMIPDPSGYGRVIRAGNQSIEKVVEHKDATAEEKLIHEINSGIYVFDALELFRSLKKINSDNAQNEYYLPDVLKIMIADGKNVDAFITENHKEISGINTVEQLRDAEEVLIRQMKENRNV